MGIESLGIIVILLTLGVVLVNGSTDAPNAISSSVYTGALKMWQACIICGVFNLLSILFFCFLSPKVADTVFSMVEIEGEKSTLLAIASVMVTTIIFGVVSGLLGMPSSESHAMLSSLFGASLAFGGRASIKSLGLMVLYGILSALISLLISLLLAFLAKRRRVRKKGWLIFSTILLSAMHGAQDGQKFVGILLIFLEKSYTPLGFFSKTTVIILVGVFMLLGSLICGKRITKALGEDTLTLSTHTGFVSDIGGFLTLSLCSLLGMPVSTGNIKACSLIGVGILEKERVNKKTVAKIAITSLATVPICFVISFLLSKILGCFC